MAYYYPDNAFYFSDYHMNADGTFTPKGFLKSVNPDDTYLYSVSGNVDGKIVGYLDTAIPREDQRIMNFKPYGLPSFYSRYVNGNCVYTGLTNYKSYIYFTNFSLNFPVFETEAQADAFLKTGDLTGLLNGEAYDFPDLATSTAERLQPLTGYEFAPGRLPGINAALSTAAAALPEPGLDPAENTEAYKKTLNAALTAALPEPAPEPEPDPDPSPSPDPSTGGEGESYKRDLKLLFPFCIPFDFIHLIQALKAEPETPKFEIPVKLDFVDVDTSIVIDLAWMDPIMKIWRLGELGLFIVMLMKSTSKMIRW